MEKKGLIFGIQHFSIDDGNGIRSVVFLKGCPMRCLWCHNPEGLSSVPQLQYFQNRCVDCGRCGRIYLHLEETADLSAEEKQNYADCCAYGALEVIGSYMTADQVLKEVMEDKIFFETSGGGITLSGGEAMQQVDFTCEVLRKAKGLGLCTALETAGCASEKDYERIRPYVDEFLWDYKETDEKKHQSLTGVSNRKILANLNYLYKNGAAIVLRCPIIPGINDTEEHFRGIADMSRRMEHLKGVELMPYHKMGVAKGKRLGKFRQQEYPVPDEAMKQTWKERIEALGGRIF